jgi:hypothetical protein
VTQATLERRKLDFHRWSEVLADIDQLHRSGYQRCGNWDLSQILDHVGEGLRTAQKGFDHQGPWIVRKLFGPLILKRILSQRKMKAGIKVPPWWLPGPAHDESKAIHRFKEDVACFEKYSATPKPHPFFGPLTKPQWNDLALIHAGHHLSFLVGNG